MKNKQKLTTGYLCSLGKKYAELNKDEMRVYTYLARQQQIQSNPLKKKIMFWFTSARARAGNCRGRFETIVGCSREEFIEHIESQFTEGMTWDNWAKDGWHIDHIVDLWKGGSNHYTNLQPLWCKDNQRKKDKSRYENNKQVIGACRTCGKDIIAWPNKKGIRHYCNRKCRWGS